MPDAAGRFSGRARFAGPIILIALVAALAGLRGAALLHDHSLHSIDGAMQTWFAASNFADGKQLGSEFQSYLGVTMILAQVPVFMALGETLYASTFAAYLWVIIGAFASAYATAWMIPWIAPRQRWAAAIVLVFVFYLLGGSVSGAIGLPYPLSFDPGVSLRPVRGALPFLVLPVFVWAIRRTMPAQAVGQTSRAGAILGLVAGAGLLWSNDAGIPLVIALTIGFASALFTRPKHLAAGVAAMLAAAVVSAAVILLIVTQGDPGPWFHYNFVAVASDQFWYFAPWDRASRVLVPADLLNIPPGGELLSVASLLILITSLAIAAVLRLMGRGDEVRLSAFLFVGSSLVGTAILPQIGGHIGGEYNHITFMLGMSAPLILLPSGLADRLQSGAKALPAALVVAGGVLAGGAMIASEGVRTHSIVSASDRSVYSAKLGFYVTPEYAVELAAMERLSAQWDAWGVPEDRRLLSVYTSTLDISAGTQSPTPVGSMIHALGPENRADFVALAYDRQVNAVTTIAPDYSGWEGWNLRANAAFFRALWINYLPIARTDQHILWAPGGGQLGDDDAACALTTDADDRLTARVTSPQAGIASIHLARLGSYSTARTSALTVIEDSPFTRSAEGEPWSDFPRYGAPNEERLYLAAPVAPGETTTLTLEMLDGSDIGWARCYARVFKPVDATALPTLSEGVDAYLAMLAKRGTE